MLVNYLAAPYEGMREKISALLKYHGSSYARLELLENVEKMAERFYAGDPSAVDEFLQVYSVKQDERKKCDVKTCHILT